MAGKACLFVSCVFGAFLLSQATPITKNEKEEYKPDIRYVQVEVDKREFNLTLVQRLHDVFSEGTAIWSIQSIEGENDDKITELKYSEDKQQINGVFYGDDEFMATLLATWDEDEHEIYYNGLINVGTKIYQVESEVDEWWRDPDVSETSDEEVQSSESDKQESEETGEEQGSKLRSSYVTKNDDVESLENSLKTLYPKILTVVDYDLYCELGRSVEKVIEYVATFWNAVDLKFSKLDSPDVKITVNGLLIVEDEHVSLTNGDLKSFNDIFVKKTGFVNYDAAFIFSRSSVESRQGQTYLGSICNRQNSIALIQDNATYEGLLSATHELGHLLNLPHDGMDRAEKCKVDSEDNVTFMSTNMESKKQLTWSQCSRDVLQEFSKSKAATCLENYWRHE